MLRIILQLQSKLTNLTLSYKVKINGGTENYFIKNFLMGHSWILAFLLSTSGHKMDSSHYTQAIESFNLSL